MPAKYRYYKDILDNGLRVVTVEMPHLHSAALSLFAKAGSRYEDKLNNGLSHFLEHMFFRGSANYPTSYALNDAIERRGGTLQATTGRDYTCYYLRVHPEFVDPGMEILAELFLGPRFDQIDIERQIVLEEIHDDYDESGSDICVDDIARAQMWPDDPLGFKIVGSRDNILRFNEEDLREHHRTFYGASNLVFCAAGAVSRDEVLRSAERWLERLNAGPEVPFKTPEVHQEVPRLRLVEQDETQSELIVSFRAVGETHADYATLQVIRRLLDDGISSRLQKQICENLGLAYDIGANTECFVDVGVLDVDVTIERRKSERVLIEILEQIRIIRDDLVSPEELEKVQRRFLWELDFSLDGLHEMTGWFGGTELFYQPETIDCFQEKVRAVTLEGVQRVARNILQPDRLVVAGLGSFTSGMKRKIRAAVDAFPA